MHLEDYDKGDYTLGASRWKLLAWWVLGDPVVRSRWLVFSGLKVWMLRRFGATIGKGVRIKPGVRVKLPWRLILGDHVWLGEEVWLDNLAPITVESNVCISQAAYLCTGNHDWSDPRFGLRCAPIVVHQGSWIGARATVGPGVDVGRGAVLTLGSVAVRSLKPMMIHSGNPAQACRKRIHSTTGDSHAAANRLT
jgi:putative colanic acid biosynthesis acetyltransferase WcaF